MDLLLILIHDRQIDGIIIINLIGTLRERLVVIVDDDFAPNAESNLQMGILLCDFLGENPVEADLSGVVRQVQQTLRFFKVTPVVREERDALALADTVLTRRLAAYIGDGTVVSRDLTCEIVGDILFCTLTAECEEQIGIFIPIPDDTAD
mgnify:CR=1 FL=1